MYNLEDKIRANALALAELAVESGEDERITSDFKNLVEAIDNVPELKTFLSSGKIPKRAKKEFILKNLKETYHPILINFLVLLTDMGLLSYLKEIYDEYMDVLAQTKGYLKAKTIISIPMSDEDIEELKKVIAAKMKIDDPNKISIETKHSSTLTPGVEIITRDKKLDMTLYSILGEIRDLLINQLENFAELKLEKDPNTIARKLGLALSNLRSFLSGLLKSTKKD